MKEQQLELFSLNYAESGNKNQPFPVLDNNSFTGKCTTDECLPFLPAAGNSNGGNVNNSGNNGNYWSSTPNSGNNNNSWNVNFNSGNFNLNNNNRNNGLTVRCVSAFTIEEYIPFPIHHKTKDQLRHFKCGRMKERFFAVREGWKSFGAFDTHYKKFKLTKTN